MHKALTLKGVKKPMQKNIYCTQQFSNSLPSVQKSNGFNPDYQVPSSTLTVTFIMLIPSLDTTFIISASNKSS
jgi:hypothetical protein